MNKEIEKTKKKGLLSSLALFGQSGYSAFLGFISFFFLSLKSSVFVLGVYNTVLASLSFFNYITNLGLGAALVQKQKIDKEHLSSALIFQTFITILICIIGIYYTDFFLSGYKHLPPEAKFIFWSLLISLVFVSLKTPPSVLLEREIQIYKNVAVQVVENTIFYLTVIIFTFLEKPLQGIILGILLRSGLGLLLIYLIKPWKPILKFSFKKLKELLSYGLLIQGNSFLALIKDDLLTIYLSKALGFEKLGFITFAKKYAEMPVRLITDNLNRVFFPIFSKFQNERANLSYFMEKLIKYNSLIILPTLIGIAFVFKHFLQVFPNYYEKWHIAIPMLYLFIISTIFVSFITPFTSFFNAIGKVHLSIRFMILWTALFWILTLIFVKFFDYRHVPWVFVIVNSTFWMVLRVAKKYVDLNLKKTLKNILIAIQVMIAYLIALNIANLFTNIQPLPFLILSILGGALVYFITLIYLEGKELVLNIIKLIWQ